MRSEIAIIGLAAVRAPEQAQFPDQVAPRIPDSCVFALRYMRGMGEGMALAGCI